MRRRFAHSGCHSGTNLLWVNTLVSIKVVILPRLKPTKLKFMYLYVGLPEEISHHVRFEVYQ